LHPNKNKLLDLFYNEIISRGKADVLSHVDSCPSCQDYVKTLHSVNETLTSWQDEKPLPQTFAIILDNISQAPVKPVVQRQSIPVTPILQIAFSICLILALIYIIQSKIVLLPVWETVQNMWFVETFGSFGFVLLLFFCVGTFITLSLTPIILFDSQKIKL